MKVRKLYGPTIRAMGPGTPCVLFEEHEAAMAEIRKELESYKTTVGSLGPLVDRLQNNNEALTRELRIQTNTAEVQTAQNEHGQYTIEELRAKLKDVQLDHEFAMAEIRKELETAKGENNDAAVAAIEFALKDDDGLIFLRLWHSGEFDSIRAEWDNVPDEVFVGADPLYREPCEE